MNTLYSNLIFTLTSQLTVDHHLLQGGKLYQKIILMLIEEGTNLIKLYTTVIL